MLPQEKGSVGAKAIPVMFPEEKSSSSATDILIEYLFVLDL